LDHVFGLGVITETAEEERHQRRAKAPIQLFERKICIDFWTRRVQPSSPTVPPVFRTILFKELIPSNLRLQPGEKPCRRNSRDLSYAGSMPNWDLEL
jgi:hypothetical protein